MTSIRRVYFYLVAFVSLEVVVWGLIGLLRNIFGDVIRVSGDDLAMALALVLVGVPIFGVHWLWAQKSAAGDEEEHASQVRAIFIYGILLFTLWPVMVDVLALINRGLLMLFGVSSARALFGADQRWSDNLISIVANGVTAAYFFNILRTDWAALTDRDALQNVRRFYRYIWTLIGLVMTAFGAQHLLNFLLMTGTQAAGFSSRPTYINGLSLLLVGTPIWVYSWSLAQKSLEDVKERFSLLRLSMLYALTFLGAIIALSTGGNSLYHLLLMAFGVTETLQELVSNLRGPLSFGLPLLVIWLYYGSWLQRDIDTRSDVPQRSGLRRVYVYVLAIIGLAVSVTGVTLLTNLLITLLTHDTPLWNNPLPESLSGAFATLAVGLPLWLVNWLPMQADAAQQDDMGGHARRSLMRKGYLYLAVFAGVIGGMVAAVRLAFLLINAALGNADTSILTDSLQSLLILLVFAGLLLYHALILRAEGFSLTQSLAERQAQFPVVVFETGDGTFASRVSTAFARQAGNIPLTTHSISDGVPEADVFRAVVMPAALAVNPPEALRLWLKDFTGTKIIVSGEAAGWVLAGTGGDESFAIGQAALAVRQLAEGQEIRLGQTSANTIWWIILGVLFGAPLILVVLGSLGSLLFG